MKIEDLKEQEVRNIIEALLFSSVSDMCADWDNKQSEDMMRLAFHISESTKIRPENVSYFESSYPAEEGEEFGVEISEKFPEIVDRLT